MGRGWFHRYFRKTRSMSKRVLLLVMPFLTLRRPHLGVGLLKAELNRAGMDCDVRYFNFQFADIIGTAAYEQIAEGAPAHQMPGEWIFTPALYGEDARPAGDFSLALVRGLKVYDDKFLQQIDRARNLSPAFIQDCVRQIDFSRYDIVGFTSTFQQNIASLAMAQAVKRQWPEVTTVCGGANFEGEMGVEIHRLFPFIDVVCSGEADTVFPELVRRLRAAEPVHDLGGVTSRAKGFSVTGSTPQSFVSDLNNLPYPDHGDYFRDLQISKSGEVIRTEVTMETSRGCWWGQKHHCTFCGLNGMGMTYRSKTPDRAYREIKHLLAKHRGHDIFNTDNIVDLKYFAELFPRLADEGVKVQLFYETKANLKKTQLFMLKRVGSTSFQPGIESLNSHVLTLMDKGIKGIQNVQLLRWSKEMEFDVSWNILCGFPGETPEDYQQITRWISSIGHLQPPIVVTRFRLDRFSPMFKDPDKYGLANVRSFPGHQICYPFPEESLCRIAYFLDCDSPTTPETLREIKTMWKAIDQWKLIHKQSSLIAEVEPGSLIVHDRRAGRVSQDYVFKGVARDIYLALDSVHTDSHLLKMLQEKYPDRWFATKQVHKILDDFERYDLVLREDNLYLALALFPLDLISEETPEVIEKSAMKNSLVAVA
jgi:ribosomal peptide maturation radical SAM protein 1